MKIIFVLLMLASPVSALPLGLKGRVQVSASKSDGESVAYEDQFYNLELSVKRSYEISPDYKWDWKLAGKSYRKSSDGFNNLSSNVYNATVGLNF